MKKNLKYFYSLVYTCILSGFLLFLFQKDNRCSVTISLAEGNFCHVKQLDPEDPRCPQVILTGKFKVVS